MEDYYSSGRGGGGEEERMLERFKMKGGKAEWAQGKKFVFSLDGSTFRNVNLYGVL